MKFSTAILSFLSLTAISLAAPHGGHGGSKDGGGTNSTTTNPNQPEVSQPAGSAGNSSLDETPGSGGSYNVIVDEDDPRTLDELITEMGLTRADLRYVFENSAFKGFSANLSSHCVGKLNTMSGFKMFEPEMDIQLHDDVPGTWGLKRVSQSSAVSTQGKDVSSFDFSSYAFNGTTDTLGKGVDIYVVDTGVKYAC